MHVAYPTPSAESLGVGESRPLHWCFPLLLPFFGVDTAGIDTSFEMSLEPMPFIFRTSLDCLGFATFVHRLCRCNSFRSKPVTWIVTLCNWCNKGTCRCNTCRHL